MNTQLQIVEWTYTLKIKRHSFFGVNLRELRTSLDGRVGGEQKRKIFVFTLLSRLWSTAHLNSAQHENSQLDGQST